MHQSARFMLGVFATASLFCLACTRPSAPASRASAKEPAGVTQAQAGGGAAQAKQLYAARCATCHGEGGKGDGVAAAALTPKPPDFTSPAWQKSVTNEHIERIIVQGGAAVGKSPLMPPNPDLANSPQVVTELRKLVRGFAK